MSLSDQAAIQFYETSTYPCSYIKGNTARSLVATSRHMKTSYYNALTEKGFRRSGTFIYRPHCDACQACTPIRLPVDQFKATRSQRRTFKHYAHLQVQRKALAWNEEHFELYRRYQAQRHTGSEMDNDDKSTYIQFLLSSPVQSALYEFRDQSELKMVALVDELEDGLSAVYTFFDPDSSGLGTYGILWQIAFCRSIEKTWLYLGYWIEQSRKMAYKTRFSPYQLYLDGAWMTPCAP